MTIVTLVGSVNQKPEWLFYNEAFTKRGYLVFDAGSYDKNAPQAVWDRITRVHQEKISLSEIVAVIDKEDGTIGEHTKADIDYAKKLGKTVLRAYDFLRDIEGFDAHSKEKP